MIRPQMFSTVGMVPGQQQWTTAGTFSFVVPDGVFEIAAVCIAPGGGGAVGASGDTSESPAGGGGALSYSNAIAVTPGETLTIINAAVGGAGSGSMSSGGNGGDSGIRRGATTFLLKSQGGRGGNWASGVGGLGGAAASGIGDVRYSGGKGMDATSFTYGGWSGQYTTSGLGGSSSYTNKSADLFGSNSGTALGRGGNGGRTTASPGLVGGIRIMWGAGRSFPSNAANV